MWHSCYCTLREAYATLTAVKCNFWPLRSLKRILQVKTLLLSWISACKEIVMLFAPGASHHQGADGRSLRRTRRVDHGQTKYLSSAIESLHQAESPQELMCLLSNSCKYMAPCCIVFPCKIRRKITPTSFPHTIHTLRYSFILRGGVY